MLNDCHACDGFVPLSADRCPSCGESVRAAPDTALKRTARALLATAAGGAVAMTLMACYGAPPPRAEEPVAQPKCQSGTDVDGDGYCTPADCNDSDPTVHPGASDATGDGADLDCDGVDGSGFASPPP